MHCFVANKRNCLLYVENQRALTQEGLDGRHNPRTRRTDVWEEVSKLYSGSKYNPASFIFPDLHDDFNDEIDISYTKIENMEELTHDKAYKKFMQLMAQFS